jgi:hypothetical protein
MMVFERIRVYPCHPPNPRSILLVLLLALCSLCCHESRQTGSEGASSPFGSPSEKSVKNSGRTLEGEFVVRSVHDDYAAQGSARSDQVRFKFDGDSHFEKYVVGASGKPRARQEGTYVIGTAQELVLYVEKVDGNPLEAALAERYTIEENSQGLQLRSSPSSTIMLERQ